MTLLCMVNTLYVQIPFLRLHSEANERIHPLAKARRTKAQREHVAWALMAAYGVNPFLKHSWLLKSKLWIQIERIGPRALDTDNLAISAKHVRDEIAKWLGVDDGSPRLEWVVTQSRGVRGEYSVNITIKKVGDE